MRSYGFLVAVSMAMLAGSTAWAQNQDIVVPDCVVDLLEEARVPAQESGMLTEVLVREGQQVKTDEVLAKIDDTLSILQKQVSLAEMYVAEKKADNKIAVEYAHATSQVNKRTFQRYLDSNKRVPGSVPAAELDLAHLKYIEATKQIEKAEFDIDVAKKEVDVAKANLVAADEHYQTSGNQVPVERRGRRSGSPRGRLVEPGDPILRLVRMDKLRVNCFLNSKQFNKEEVYHRPVTVTVYRAPRARKRSSVSGHRRPSRGQDRRELSDLDRSRQPNDGRFLALKLRHASRRRHPHGPTGTELIRVVFSSSLSHLKKS